MNNSVVCSNKIKRRRCSNDFEITILMQSDCSIDDANISETEFLNSLVSPIFECLIPQIKEITTLFEKKAVDNKLFNPNSSFAELMNNNNESLSSTPENKLSKSFGR